MTGARRTLPAITSNDPPTPWQIGTAMSLPHRARNRSFFGDVIATSVPGEHDAAATERIRNQAVGPSGHILLLNLQHAVGMFDVPCYATAAWFQPGAL